MSGRLVVISGPSGVGKTVICDRLVSKEGWSRVVTATSRAPRAGERDGVDYHFMTEREFSSGIERGEFVEHAKVHGNLYGTPRSEIEKFETDAALLNIDVQGARILMNEEVAATYIFIDPPSLEALEQRLRARGSDSDETIALRLANAREELAVRDEYDHRVVNDIVEEAVDQIVNLLNVDNRNTDK